MGDAPGPIAHRRPNARCGGSGRRHAVAHAEQRAIRTSPADRCDDRAGNEVLRDAGRYRGHRVRSGRRTMGSIRGRIAALECMDDILPRNFFPGREGAAIGAWDFGARRISLTRCAGPLQRLAIVGASLFAFAVHAQPALEVPPIGLGQYTVACSNVEQDFSRVPAGANVQDYWEGFPAGNSTRYVTDLLVDPVHAFVVQVPIPKDSNLFGSFSGATIPYANLVCYPTDAGQRARRTTRCLPATWSRTCSAVPSRRFFRPRPAAFQSCCFRADSRAARFPATMSNRLSIWRASATSWWRRSMATRASPTSSSTEFKDTFYALLHFKDFVAMQAVRPLSLSVALDAVLAHPDFRDHVDAANVGAFGASLGGESILLMAGAALTTSIGAIVEPCHARYAAQGGRRLRPVFRHRRLSGVRAGLEGSRRSDAVLSRDQRYRRHYGADQRDRARNQAARPARGSWWR